VPTARRRIERRCVEDSWGPTSRDDRGAQHEPIHGEPTLPHGAALASIYVTGCGVSNEAVAAQLRIVEAPDRARTVQPLGEVLPDDPGDDLARIPPPMPAALRGSSRFRVNAPIQTRNTEIFPAMPADTSRFF
jgi:hypothetical protein